MTPPTPAQDFSALDALAGRSLLLTGATGFIGKVALSLLLERQPGVGKVYVLVRPKPGKKPRERFFDAVASSPALLPLRRAHRAGFEAFLDSRVTVLEGDVTLPDFGLDEAALAGLAGRLDVLLNVAGLVSFNPSLDESLAINVDGARHAAALALRLGAKLVHVSTCYVAGNRKGPVSESEPLAGFYPERDRRSDSFDASRELATCRELVARVHSQAEARSAEFSAQARRRLDGKGTPSERMLKGTASRLSRAWITETLIAEGLARARSWGWPNIYCYTKAIGEQLIASAPGLQFAVVRPSIVESALEFPFPGWNEGFNTSAPVILAMCKAVTPWPAHPTAPIDVVPVDQVAAALLAVSAAAVAGRHEPVYHLGTTDTNPMGVRRCMHMVGEYSRRSYGEHAAGSLWWQWLRSRAGVVTVGKRAYQLFGAPGQRRALAFLSDRLGRVLPQGAVRTLSRLDRELAQVEYVVSAFMPFIHDTEAIFRTDRIRALYAGLSARDRELLPWRPEAIDWRHYWLDVHTEGLRKWVFPQAPGQPIEPARWAFNAWARAALAALQRAAYASLFESEVSGAENVPGGRFIAASNHASHLDMGLVKHALGPAGEGLVALAAKDYFFRSSVLAYFFQNYTNLLPIGRRTGLKDSLHAAAKTLKRGRNLLIFPEATRSRSGRMAPFKSTLGYLALKSRVDVLPIHLSGTFEALPTGRLLPRSRKLKAVIGKPLTYAELERATAHLPPKDAYRAATALVEAAVRRLAGLPEAAEPAPPQARPLASEPASMASNALPKGRPDVPAAAGT